MSATDAAFEHFLTKSPEFMANPYPFYRQMQTGDPVHWSEAVQGWVLTRHQDCAFVLSDPLFVKMDRAPEELPPAYERFRPLLERNGQMMLTQNPPDHTRLRGLVSKAFTPRMVEQLRPRIQQLADDLLDAALENGEIEMMRGFAIPFPLSVIAAMLDLPIPDLRLMKQWSDAITLFFFTGNPLLAEQALTSVQDIDAYLRPIIAQRRKHPGEDVLSTMVLAQERGDMLSEGELLANIGLMIHAGHETTTNLIGNGLLALLQHPDQMQQVRDDPALMPAAIEELLRYDSSIQMDGRTASVATEIGGKQIQPGQILHCVLGAANRDPDAFVAPDRLDVTRGKNKHMAFALGIHYCLGAPLARLEGQIAFATLLRRFPTLTLATDELAWQTETLTMRGLHALPVSVK